MLKTTTLCALTAAALTLPQTALAQTVAHSDPAGPLEVVTFASGVTNADGVPLISGFSIAQIGLDVVLERTVDLLEQAYPDISRDYLVVAEDGTRFTALPTVETVWGLVADDPDVFGVVPIGYSETAGEADIAGLFRIGDRERLDLFSAENLDTIFCVNDVARDSFADDQFVNSFLFDVTASDFFTFRYTGDLKDVVLDHLGQPDRWAETFERCPAMIQTGYRLINPFHITRQLGQTSRIATTPETAERIGPFPMVSMIWDRDSRFSFVQSQEIKPHALAQALSDPSFYPMPCSPARFATGCEIWGLGLTAFDGTGFVVRPTSGAAPQWFGRPDVVAPAVLVLRRWPQDAEALEDPETADALAPSEAPVETAPDTDGPTQPDTLPDTETPQTTDG